MEEGEECSLKEASLFQLKANLFIRALVAEPPHHLRSPGSWSLLC